MKLGVFSVMLPEFTPEQAAEAVSRAGYDGLEWRVTQVPTDRQLEAPSFWGHNRCTLAPTQEDAVRARELAAAAGLELPNLGTYIGLGDLAAVRTAMQLAQTAGSPQIRVGVGPYHGDYPSHVAAAQRFLAEVAGLAQQFGVRALLELHHGTLVPNSALAYRLIEDFDPAHIGVIYDPGNMVWEGSEDYLLGAELLGPYLAHVHLKNAAYDRPEGGGVWRPRWSPLEDGVVDFGRLLSALARVGYDGWLVVEDFSDVRQGRAALEHNLAFIRGKLAAHAAEAAETPTTPFA